MKPLVLITTLSLASLSTVAAHAQALYTFGHGDLAVEDDETEGAFEVHLHVEDATIDGVLGVSDEFEVDTLAVVTDGSFTRPNDAGAGFPFDPLCVGIGEDVFWLLASNIDASALGVPFLGWANEVPDGVFVDDEVSVRLVDVDAPGGAGTFSLWGFGGLFPEFHISNEDGIGPEDVLVLPAGHDHFNMGFGPATAVGEWTLGFEVSGELLAGGPPVVEPFEVTVVTGELPPVPAPALGGLGALGWAGLLLFVGAVRRRFLPRLLQQ